ncbi:MAG: lysophospholipase L1-like esterase [Planctomycetota bacterium]|jgi:lysophospholipase L1-like esterase
MRILWRPGTISDDLYREFTPAYSFGFDHAQPVFDTKGDKLVTRLTEYRRYKPQEMALEKPKGALRLAAIGGSSLGGSVCYLHRVGELMRERCPGVNIETLNLGVPGFGSARMHAILSQILQHQFDVVVIDVGITNEFEDEEAAARRSQQLSGPTGLVFESQLITLLRKLVDAGTGVEATATPGAEKEARKQNENILRWRELTRVNIQAMIQEASVHGTEIILVGRAIQKNESPGDWIRLGNSTAAKVGEALGTPFIDAFELTRWPGGNEWLFKDNGHLSLAGHLHLAEHLVSNTLPMLDAFSLHGDQLSATRTGDAYETTAREGLAGELSRLHLFLHASEMKLSPKSELHQDRSTGSEFIRFGPSETRVTFTVKTPRVGTFVLWAAARSIGSDSDILRVQVDGDPERQWQLGSPHGIWSWKTAGPYLRLSSGSHTVIVSASQPIDLEALAVLRCD